MATPSRSALRRSRGGSGRARRIQPVPASMPVLARMATASASAASAASVPPADHLRHRHGDGVDVGEPQQRARDEKPVAPNASRASPTSTSTTWKSTAICSAPRNCSGFDGAVASGTLALAAAPARSRPRRRAPAAPGSVAAPAPAAARGSRRRATCGRKAPSTQPARRSRAAARAPADRGSRAHARA
jgi:DNA-binding protein HU-beta